MMGQRAEDARIRTERDPHAGLAPVRAGVPLEEAAFALVLVHGRGGSPLGMLPLARAAGALDGAVIAPAAADGSWYPDRFLAPVENNEPWLSSALSSLARGVQEARDAGLGSEHIVIAGFSQGACLALEFVARNPQRYGGVAALAGALVGENAAVRAVHTAVGDTPMLLACGDVDAHIPESRVRTSAASFANAGAVVDLRIYPGLGHTVIEDQIDALRAMLDAVRARPHVPSRTP
jgi:phospholipase/carboxylesterase